MKPEKSLIKLNNFSVYYGKLKAVDSVHLCAQRGEGVGLMGENGAGKTSLLKGIIGLVRTTGTRYYKGESLDGYRPHSLRKVGISYSPQDKRVFHHMTVRENLRVNAGREKKKTLDRSELDLFPELVDHLDQIAATLSGGERVMLGLIMAMMGEPELLLLDEPTEGLMPELELNVYRALGSAISGGLSVLIAEQNRDLLKEMCTKNYLLNRGSLEKAEKYSGRS